MFRSIRWKLTSSYIVLYLLTILLLGILLFGFLDRYFRQTMADNLEAEAIIISQTAHNLLSQKTAPELDSLAKELGEQLTTRITFIAPDGQVLGDSDEDIKLMENHFNHPEIQQALSEGQGTATRFSTTINSRMFYLAMPVKNEGNLAGFVRLALPLTAVQQALGQLNNSVSGIIVLSSLILALASLKFASQLTRPLEQLNRTAKEIAHGKFDRRISYRGRDEIGQLAVTMNRMARSIQTMIDELSDQKSKLETVLNTMANGVAVFNETGELILINPAALEYFGVKKEQVLHHPAYCLWRAETFSDTLRKVIAGGKPQLREYRISRPRQRVLSTHFVPIRQKEIISQVVVVFADITSIRHLEEMRSQFVANVSHELRTPLTSINGFAETLLEGTIEDRDTALRFLRIIAEETQRMNRIIDDLLDLSQIEVKKQEMEMESINLREVVAQVAVRLEKHFEKKDQSFDNLVPNQFQVTANRDHLAQVFVNLLSNSIKYTPPGGQIKVQASAENNQIKIVVNDTGIGIPHEDQPRIFERFYRVDKARSRQLGGTGLGLAIVKHIVEAHGGRVWVESRLGHGSSFYFTLTNAKMI